MEQSEIKLRCIEAAARAPNNHVGGFAAGVLETAKSWYDWVIPTEGARPVLGLPGKK
jgi:hypothetical protein